MTDRAPSTKKPHDYSAKTLRFVHSVHFVHFIIVNFYCYFLVLFGLLSLHAHAQRCILVWICSNLTGFSPLLFPLNDKIIVLAVRPYIPCCMTSHWRVMKSQRELMRQILLHFFCIGINLLLLTFNRTGSQSTLQHLSNERQFPFKRHPTSRPFAAAITIKSVDN